MNRKTENCMQRQAKLTKKWPDGSTFFSSRNICNWILTYNLLLLFFSSESRFTVNLSWREKKLHTLEAMSNSCVPFSKQNRKCGKKLLCSTRPCFISFRALKYARSVRCPSNWMTVSRPSLFRAHLFLVFESNSVKCFRVSVSVLHARTTLVHVHCIGIGR